jgi:glycosyltransferase involved in cell wall biosynthesis
MNVVIVTGAFPPMKCGVGDYTFLLAEQIANEKNSNVTVLTTKGCTNKISGVNVLPIIDKWNFHSFRMVIKKIKQIRPDVVHIQYPTVGYERYLMPSFLPVLLKINGIKNIIQTWHEPLSKKGWIRYFPNTLISSKLIFVEKDFMNKLPTFYHHLLRRREKSYIPITSNIPETTLNQGEKELLRKNLLGSDYNKNIIVYFGFISPKKGIEYLLQSADPEKDFLMFLCEFKDSNDYHQELKQKIAEYGWTDNIFISGYLKDDQQVADYLSIADTGVFPFTEGATERNGSILAARMQGVFVITTSEKATGYTSKRDMYFVEPKNIHELKEAISLNRDRKPIKRFDVGLISWDEIGKKHFEVYRQN